MATLEVNFAGIKLKNPLVIASSELTNTPEKIKLAHKWGAAAVSTKLAFLQVPFYARPYHILERGGGFYSPSGQRLNVTEAQRLIDQAKRETDLIIIANMMGPGSNVEGWAELGKRLEEAGADLLELNMSCPNVGLMAQQAGVDVTEELGAALGQNAALSREVTRAVVSSVRIPVMPKMTPEANTALVAEECGKGGAAAVSAINCPQSLPGCDIYNDGQPLYPSTRNQSFAGLCGPWIRPLAFRHVAQIASRVPELPICGGGGLTSWTHVVQMIMYGATTVSFCTLLYNRGFEVLPSLEQGLNDFMEKQGYQSILDFRGKALKYIVTPNRIEYLSMVPKINEARCNGCEICTKMGHCEVLFMQEKKARVLQPEKCPGCSVCAWICPLKAIEMVPA